MNLFPSVSCIGTLMILLLALPGSLSATSPSSLETLVIQEGGRKKPYLVFTEETLRSLSGKATLPRESGPDPAMAVITRLWMHPSASWKERPMILVSNLPLKRKTGLDISRKLFSYNELTSSTALLGEIAAAAESRRRDTRAKLAPLQKEAADVGMRLGFFESLLHGEAFRILPPASGNDWLPLFPEGTIVTGNEASMIFGELSASWSGDDQEAFDHAAERIIALQKRMGTLPDHWKLELEVLYQKVHPFRLAWILYAMAGIVMLALRGPWEHRGYQAAWILAGGGFLLQAAGLASRVLIAGRPPVTNMYESVIWVAFGTVLFALIFETIYRAGTFLLGAVPVAVASLILADSQPMILDRSIHPLVPVLRDNFWLTTHVLSITLSYAAFALALGVAHVVLGRIIAGHRPAETLYLYLYRTLQVGVLLLATGTILGGVWANYSWGRFWDWDPKETWALTALLGYLFLLHGRITGLWGGFGLAVGSVLAFLSVLMAWYGVNFVLGAGLHSYGFGTGGFSVVFSFVGLELVFVLLAFLRRGTGKTHPPV